MKNQPFILIILLVFVFFSCKHEVENITSVEENLLEVSKEQFRSENMIIGRIERTKMLEKVPFTGMIVPKVNAIAKISALVPGRITSIKVQNGQFVQANEPLLYIGGGKIIDLQRNFASSSAKINQLKSNYNKAKELYTENIKTENEFLLAESNYKVELANYTALKKKIQNIGLSIENIEEGNYVSQYSLKATISGHVTDINTLKGQYVNSEDELVEIIDNRQSILQLTLFEKDYVKIKVGQTVQFWNMDKNTTESIAIIERIGVKLNTNSNTFHCLATISDKTDEHVINQMVNGEIITSADSIYSLPKSSLFTIGSNQYVLIKKSEDDKKYVFEKRKVNTGRTSNEFIEVLDGIKNEEILISGTYNLHIE